MMMMPIMSGTGSLTMALTQRGRPIMVVAAFLALIGSIAIGAMILISQRSGKKRQVRESRERYLDYIEAMRHTIRDQIAGQRSEQAWRHPHASELLDICHDGRRRWERRLFDDDFLRIRVGTGEVPLGAGLTLDADTGPLNEFDPVCLQSAQELQHRYATLRDQPIALDVRPLGQVSVLGSAPIRRLFATNMAARLIALHSPQDVAVAVVRSDDSASQWDWLKWVPHAHDAHALDGDVPARMITSSVPAMAELLAPDLDARLDTFRRSRGGGRSLSHLVVMIDSAGLPPGHHLVSPDAQVSLAQLGVHVINLLDSRRQEPESVDERITLADDGSVTMTSQPRAFTVDMLPDGLEHTIARMLSSLRLTLEEGTGDELSDTVGLPEILGVDDPARLDLNRSWKPRSLRELLRVPIGIGSDGKTVMLDIKESAHGGMGPHGLVVGATGSGKSEMLRTLVSSLVIGHNPDRLALMLVDFKGGATFASMEHIPHMAGMITNLEDDLTLVDRMRDALFGEMQRRQEVLKKAGNLPNVTAYHDRIDAGENLEPLPHLLVIIDEFSELLTAKPDFADLFVAIGRIGRSIGVHLLLATQKLDTGSIRGLESHLSYRISLRTFSETESRDAIGVPDAYHLPPEPGSGYLKVDTTVFERFKAALVSSPYVPPSQAPKSTVPVVPYIAVNGVGAWLAHQFSESAKTPQNDVDAALASASASTDPTVLDVLCDQLAGSRAAPVRPVWLPPLPEIATLDRVQNIDERADPTSVTAALGLVDEPANQDQYPLEWDFAGAAGNVMIAGGPQMGKSTLLRTMVASMSLRYAPGTVAFYCIDHGGGSLQTLKRLPHVAGVTTPSDPERIHRTIHEVRGILDSREAVFRKYDLENMQAFRRARANGDLPTDIPGDVFLIIDGWANVKEDFEDLDYAVDEIASRGGNYGVHVILTVTQSMQVRMRMQPSFTGRIELKLADVFDSSFGRKLMEQIPKDTPGRGALEGERLFQATIPRIDGVAEIEDLTDGQQQLFDTICQRWQGAEVERVETLPSLIRVEELPPLDPAYPGVPVGALDRNLRAVNIDLMNAATPHLQVYGDPETGKTNMLKMLLNGYTELMDADRLGIVLIDFRRSLLDVVPEEYLVAYCTSREQTERVSDEIAGILHGRLPDQDVTSEQLKERNWWSGLELLVIADDFDLVATSSGNPMASLVEYIPQGYDLGFHLVLSRRINGLARAQFDPMIQRLGDVSTAGFMFSGDRLEGRLVNGIAPARLPHGRALYANRNGLIGQVQTAVVPDNA